MQSSYVTQDLSDVLKVVQPNDVTPNKSVDDSNSLITNMAPKIDRSWTDYKKTCSIAFPYHGDKSFAEAAYGNGPNMELLQNTESSSDCNRSSTNQFIGSVT